ncbi:RNA-guided endonuclease InsQ/TnpB family protein [Streptomyces sp. NPDC012421]|uniref:RNA-guided endonuclease InsQ/TnpB family protein n=1 Tax=Streptomyces sp. NPDC012421 TaxID=3364832 RepID=UPI0036F0A809
MSETATTIVVKEALDPTPAQVVILQRYANASRCSFNYALGIKRDAQQRWGQGRDRLVAQGQTPAEAARNAPKVKVPGQFDIQKLFLAERDRPLVGPLLPGQTRYRFPWWKGVNAIVCQQAFRDADAAFANWKGSARRKGGPVGFPRFKRPGRCRDSFRMVGIRLVEQDLRHVRIGGERGGQPAFTVRLHRPARRLARLLARGGETKMVTVAREGHRWFVAFNVRVPAGPAPRASRRQRAAGTVGVDLGVKVFAATSDPLLINSEETQLFENPRLLENAQRQLKRWQRHMARRHVRGRRADEQSNGWKEARDHVARLHALVAARRSSTQHLLTKRIVTQYDHVAIEDLRVKNMTASAHGTKEKPGRNVQAKAGLNRSILDVGFGEIRRQIEYKARLYGTAVSVVDPAYTSQTCNRCGHVDAKNRRTRDLFTCTRCGHATHADIGAAINIKNRAQRPTEIQERPADPPFEVRPLGTRKAVSALPAVPGTAFRRLMPERH